MEYHRDAIFGQLQVYFNAISGLKGGLKRGEAVFGAACMNIMQAPVGNGRL
jgi:hypothetical protein